MMDTLQSVITISGTSKSAKITGKTLAGAGAEVIGLPNVITRLRDRLGRFVKGAVYANFAAGNYILKESNEIAPLDSGNMIESGFVRQEGIGPAKRTIVGYTADYTTLVHEMVDHAHGQDYNIKYATEIAAGMSYTHTPTGETRIYHTRRPQEQAKFLEVATRKSIPVVRNIIRRTTVAHLLKGRK